MISQAPNNNLPHKIYFHKYEKTPNRRPNKVAPKIKYDYIAVSGKIQTISANHCRLSPRFALNCSILIITNNLSSSIKNLLGTGTHPKIIRTIFSHFCLQIETTLWDETSFYCCCKWCWFGEFWSCCPVLLWFEIGAGCSIKENQCGNWEWTLALAGSA